ncbi:DUF4917 family protein [Pseudomonas sp. nanlin1]|uniref:DUF4917 family protein n=1 Tax=Pseudomonas sp. nanlin1 TaxID=3040605 RepID=UPI00388F30E3
MKTQAFDATLADWPALHEPGGFSGLLLGNGASRAVWRNFAYDSLFETARSVANRPLGLTDLALFKSLGTQSFVRVLSDLNAAVRVNAALAISSTAPLNRYYSIKEALIHAMRSVHIPWERLPGSHLQAINQALAPYTTIYSTNYDLLLHWAVQANPDGFDELVRDDLAFDLRNTRSPASRVLYLHGALHLVHDNTGTTRMRSAVGSSLLDGFAINTPGDVPLFVNEGPSEEKQRTIRASDYLSWCNAQLSRHEGAMCLFGHQLGTQDLHIVQALREARLTRLAISIFPLSDAWVISQKARYSQLFEGSETQLQFFDATSHPLGRPELGVANGKRR